MKKLIILLIFLMCALLYGFFIEPNIISTNTVNIPVAKISEKIANLKIVFLSDIHYRANDSENRRMKRLVDKVNAMKPDLVLLGGDYICEFLQTDSENIKGIGNFLSQIKSKYGTYSVLGNHDYFYGHQTITKEFCDRKITILDNESITLDIDGAKLHIVGIPFYNPNIKEALKNISGENANDPVIFLAHTPDAFDDIAEIPIENQTIVLSGHTHGGQIYIPFFNIAHLILKNEKKYVRGLFAKKNFLMYVSVGLGNSIPNFRMFAIPEIVIVKLSKAKNQ